ncbi:unnamed protein product [Arabidopsis halleri]
MLIVTPEFYKEVNSLLFQILILFFPYVSIEIPIFEILCLNRAHGRWLSRTR